MNQLFFKQELYNSGRPTYDAYTETRFSRSFPLSNLRINILGFTILTLKADLIHLLAAGITTQPLCRLSY